MYIVEMSETVLLHFLSRITSFYPMMQKVEGFNSLGKVSLSHCLSFSSCTERTEAMLKARCLWSFFSCVGTVSSDKRGWFLFFF